MATMMRVKPFAVSSRRCCVRVAASATTTVAPPKVDLKYWKPLNLTKNNLVEAQGGETTRNIDGVVYYITYDKAADDIVVVDKKLGVRYPAVTDDQNRVRIDTTRPLPHAVAGFSPDTFGPVLRADAPAAEVINGRAGMVGFLGIAVTEVLTNQSALQQLTSPAGVAAALAAGVLTFAASVAPAVAGRVPAVKVVANENDAFADGPLPYTWNALAEKVNGRVAMVGLLGLILAEQFARGGAALL